jgi:hypothetical protein
MTSFFSEYSMSYAASSLVQVSRHRLVAFCRGFGMGSADRSLAELKAFARHGRMVWD